MNMVKNIGGKIEGKIKSGEIKESELMSEGMDLLNKCLTLDPKKRITAAKAL